jgi:hypothetical protein
VPSRVLSAEEIARLHIEKQQPIWPSECSEKAMLRLEECSNGPYLVRENIPATCSPADSFHVNEIVNPRSNHKLAPVSAGSRP